MKTLREILKEKNIKQSIVAEALNIKVNHLGRYDDLSKRSLEEVLKIEEVTGIPLEELTGGVLLRKYFNVTERSKNAVNTGTIEGSIITGDNNTVGNKNAQLLLLENENKYLKKMLDEKERLIQTLLNKLS